MAARAKTAQFRITEEEDAHLRKAARDAGFDKLSEYLRAVTLHPTVVVVNGATVTLVPSTITLQDADDALRERFRAILAGLKEAPAQASPGGEGGVVGSAPPAVPPPDGTSISPPAGDAHPGPEKSSAPEPLRSPDDGVAPGELEPAGAGACPDCGGRDGQHQSFCEQVRGEPPVTGTEAPQGAPAPTGSPIESREQFIERRVREQEAEGAGTSSATIVAEAEWRQLTSAGAQSSAPPALQPCPTCGAMKAPNAQCRDCGTRPLAA